MVLPMFSVQKRRPKVFGLGLSRTGTTSLNRALRRLGYCVHGYDPALLEAWRAGNREALFAITDKFDGFEDWPYPLAYMELVERYGADARYILTVRIDAQTWLASYTAHADRKGAESERYRQLAYGYRHPRGFEEQHIGFYERHNQAVRDAIKTSGLEQHFAEVCWERGDGWREICALIGQRVPNIAFPHKNRLNKRQE